MEKKRVRDFFSGLTSPLQYGGWSWGALTDSGILLRTWSEELSVDGRVVVFQQPTDYLHLEYSALEERIGHLRALWKGGVAGYAVLVSAKAIDVPKWVVKECLSEHVFAIDRLEARADGAVVALLGARVAVDELPGHSAQHRLSPAEGRFPVDVAESRILRDEFAPRLEDIRDLLIALALTDDCLTYSALMAYFGLTFFALRAVTRELGTQSVNNGEPILAALLVDTDTMRCSEALAEEFGVVDVGAERYRLAVYWAHESTGMKHVHERASVGAPKPHPVSLDDRARRFSQVEGSSESRIFRETAFLGCRGRCVISDCNVLEELEVASLEPRRWQGGGIEAPRGILLRRDFHALYQAGQLTFDEAGRVVLEPQVLESRFGLFHGQPASLPRWSHNISCR